MRIVPTFKNQDCNSIRQKNNVKMQIIRIWVWICQIQVQNVTIKVKDRKFFTTLRCLFSVKTLYFIRQNGMGSSHHSDPALWWSNAFGNHQKPSWVLTAPSCLFSSKPGKFQNSLLHSLRTYLSKVTSMVNKVSFL